MRVGVQMAYYPTSPEPSEIPAKQVRCLLWDGPESGFATTASYVRRYQAAGIHVLLTVGWDWPITNYIGLLNAVDVPILEFGNEPPPEQWPAYFDALASAAPVIRERISQRTGQHVKLMLAAAMTAHSEEFLDAAPSSTFHSVDAVAIHPYDPKPGGVQQRVKTAKAQLPADLDLELWVTEVGFGVRMSDTPRTIPSGQPIETIHPVVETEDEQAHQLHHTLRLLRELHYVTAVSVFGLRDWPPWAPYLGLWWRGAGLETFDASRRKEKPWEAVRSAAL